MDKTQPIGTLPFLHWIDLTGRNSRIRSALITKRFKAEKKTRRNDNATQDNNVINRKLNGFSLIWVEKIPLRLILTLQWNIKNNNSVEVDLKRRNIFMDPLRWNLWFFWSWDPNSTGDRWIRLRTWWKETNGVELVV